MVVRIIRREAAAPPKEEERVVPPIPTQVGLSRPEIKKTIKLGEWEIRADLDLHYEQGRAKFLLHLRRDMWFEVVDFDESEKKTLKLRGKDGHTFLSKVDGTVARNYMVAVTAEGIKVPTDEVLLAVRKLVTAPTSISEKGATILMDNGGSVVPPSGQKRPVKKDAKKAAPKSAKGKAMSKDKPKKEAKKPAKKPAKK